MSIPAKALDITIAWDARPWELTVDGIRIYELANAEYTLLDTIGPDEVTYIIHDITSGSHTYIIRYYLADDESGDSNSVTYPLPTNRSRLKR